MDTREIFERLDRVFQDVFDDEHHSRHAENDRRRH